MPRMPEAPARALVKRCYARLGEHLGDAVAMLASARLVPIELDPCARAILEEARAEGRGVVFVSAHLGPWERVAGSLVAAGFPLTTIAREAYDPRLTALYDALRGPLGVRVVYRGAQSAAMGIVRALKRGDLLGVPMATSRSRHPCATAARPTRCPHSTCGSHHKSAFPAAA